MDTLTRMRSVRAGRSNICTSISDALGLTLTEPGARKYILLTIAVALWTLTVIIAGHKSKCYALLSFGICGLQDVTGLLEKILSFWIDRTQRLNRSKQYTFGFSRFKVLATLAFAVITLLGALYSVKESLAQAITHEDIIFDGLLAWSCVAIVFHMVTAFLVRCVNRDDLGGRMQLLKLLRYLVTDESQIQRVCCSGLLLASILTIEISENAIYVDTAAGSAIGIILALSVVPELESSILVLIQSISIAKQNQIQQCLREISTFDGILEFSSVHVWTIANDELVGTIHVRVRRDAKEKDILAQVTNKLAPLIHTGNLTVQVIKDDWMNAAAMTPFTPVVPSSVSRTSSNGTPLPSRHFAFDTPKQANSAA